MNVPVAALGYGARKMAEDRTRAGAQQLSEIIRARSPSAQAALAGGPNRQAIQKGTLQSSHRIGCGFVLPRFNHILLELVQMIPRQHPLE